MEADDAAGVHFAMPNIAPIQAQTKGDTPGAVVPFPSGRLEPDRQALRGFANALFRNCRGLTGWIALSTFGNGAGKCISRKWAAFDKDLIDAAHRAAAAAANRPRDDGAVFAPPVCLFRSTDNASGANVAVGPVIAVDLDKKPLEGLTRLTGILGTPTLIVASGGRWTADDGTLQDKLHVYWRLVRPATTDDDLARLRHVRRLAAIGAFDADMTGISVVHPMRWPGSWHTKAAPALCRIVGGDIDREIDLAAAAGLLEAATADAPELRQVSAEPRKGFKTKRPWTAETLLEVARAIPNDAREWADWVRLGMTFFDASHGSRDGLDAFHALSEQHPKYDLDATNDRWSHWHRSPPSNLSAGTLVHEMQKVYPRWKPTWPADAPADPALFEPRAEADTGPLDIFGDADPGELANLPSGALPPMMARWVRSEARRKGVPESFATINAVAVFGAAIGGDVRLQVRQRDDSWTEAANLYTVIVAPPGSAKSPIISAATAPLRRVNDRWVEHDSVAHARWAASTKRRGKDAPEPGPEPRIRRLVVDDMTSEKAIRIYRDNPRGVLQAPDELAGLLGGFGAYKSGGGADRAHFLRAFDGDSIVSDRVGSGTIAAKRALLTVVSSTQPEKLRALVRDLGTDGLLQRFVAVLHDGRERQQLDEEPDRDAAAWFASSIERLAAAGQVMADPVRLSPEAGAALAAALEQIKVLKHVPGASDAFRGHLEKWGKILPRLVLIVHVANALDQGDGFDVTARVEPETVAMAVRLARFFLRHALAFYSTYFSSTASATEAVWIAGWLLTRPELRTLSRRDIYTARKALQGADNLRVLVAAMGELEAAGWCTAKERDSSGPTTWTIDQRIHERFAERAEREREDRNATYSKIRSAKKATLWLNDGADASVATEAGIFG